MVIKLELIKEKWTKKDGINFNKYLYTLKNQDKIAWTKNIIRTKKPTLAIQSPVLKQITHTIKKGNYMSFLDLNLNTYHENTIINAYLISEIKDFNTMKKYLDIYSNEIDNWSSCDTLKFNIKNNTDNYYKLINEYIKSDKTFVRRIGLSICFNFIDKEHIKKVLNIIDSFKEEKQYYVNMMLSWLLCECFIKQKNITINYLKNNNLNNFVINKTIAKCRDSYRVTKEEKEMLLKYKR